MSAPPESTVPVDRPRLSLWRVIAVGLVLGSLGACVAEIVRMVGDRNKHVVVPGRVYRSAQLSPGQLAAFVRGRGVRTVINLRGRPFDDWYPAEMRATQALGVSQEDITTSANRLPSPGEIRRLIEVFDRSEHPLLIHCQQGADRTGLAAAMYQLLYTDASYEAARRQCSLRFGHLRIHTAASMDEFFDRYEDWLRQTGQPHFPAAFRHWATEVYSPGPNQSRLELLSPTGPTDAARPTVFVVRAYNTSPEPWQLKAGSGAGVHANYVVQAPDGQIAFGERAARAGFFDATIPPGGHVDLNLPVPALKTPGRYRLYVDLMTRNVSFTQYGSEALIHDWDARDPAPPRGP
jgi:protein tyrosine phosphatase (PTP) superfamily phosphohydrolase (DUF442 family)